ncbi:glycosyltransferase family 4 protein [Mycolicibacterium helvum]|uniref:glycosyltransferase family 4 protein n=1 Tax=Mycolicibacterium helvum TaxID=1534349 RepID=UPI001FE3AE5F|nr:glycosyltransferase family 4 protein [Mycolicibacterium helvum]
MRAPHTNHRALWISTSTDSRGGISTFVRDMQTTQLWKTWHIRHIATHRNGSITDRIATFAVGLVQAIYELLAHRPQIVHIHVSAKGSFARKCVISWMCYGLRVPVVLHVHGSNFDEFFDQASPAVKALIRGTLEHADVVIGLGRTWTTRLQIMAPRARVEAATCAVRPDQPVGQVAGGPVNCVFLGEVGERKGTFVLLEAWAKALEHTAVEATLTIAGDGDTARARSLVADLGLASTVEVVGWLSSSAVSQLLKRSHVLVLPSRNEGTPIAILEAMASGLCVVASDVGGIPELLADTGVMVKPDDVAGIAEALTHVIDDHQTRSLLGTRALSRVKSTFDLDALASRLDSLYRSILGAECGETVDADSADPTRRS